MLDYKKLNARHSCFGRGAYFSQNKFALLNLFTTFA